MQSGRKPTFLLRFNIEMPATDRLDILESMNALAERAAEDTGIEIVEVQLRGAGKARLVRVYIDRVHMDAAAADGSAPSGTPKGVTHADCELISERFGKLLDESDAIPGEGYTLEVSSPGVERKLTRPRDFQRVVGQKIRLALRQPIEGQTRFEGKLAELAGDQLQVEVQPGRLLRIPIDQVQKANLKFEW